MFQLLLAFCLTASDGSADPKQGSLGKPELHCGSYCLFVALRALDIDIPSVESLEEKLGQPGMAGYSMEQLARAAEAFGAHTLGIETSLEHLERRPGRFACIALLEGSSHYVCIYDVHGQGIGIVDPPNSQVVQREAFAPIWSGKALLIARSPIEPLLGATFPFRTLAAVLAAVILAAVAIRFAGPVSRFLTRRTVK